MKNLLLLPSLSAQTCPVDPPAGGLYGVSPWLGGYDFFCDIKIQASAGDFALHSGIADKVVKITFGELQV